ncbi:DoxX family protein [Actinokineospora inagensis]|uniref:DoxX family protein n=1 Tax=Actinokineospora inagensis TaxID=103730 RepID=UPI0003F66BAE|nr:DoxX family protein [Actinokineospora inagensis]
MSTEDDRPRQSGGYADSGYFTPSESTYPTTPTTGGADAYSGGTTAALPRPNTTSYDDDPDRREEVLDRAPHTWHVGADLGLLVLRVVLGALVLGHGLQKVFGLFEGAGIDGFGHVLSALGFQHATILSWVTGITELAAGALLILGLFTPAAAGAVLAIVANAIWIRVDVNLFAGGVEIQAIYAAAAFTLLFTGAGRASLDNHTPWFRRAPAFGFVFLILAAAASVVTLVVLR